LAVLERLESAGAVVLVSPRLRALGVPHAFSTRAGGVSAGPYESLNFGSPMEIEGEGGRDPAANIRENYRRLLDAAGLAGRTLLEVHQVHGCAVFTGPPAPGPAPRADAIVTGDPALAAAVRTADCAPVLLASGDGRTVGAVHAGWRGAVAGVAAAAVEQMRARGARGIFAAIGPCIGPESFEVGAEVAAEFRRVFGEGPLRPHPEGGKSFIDLRAAIAHQLRAAGVDQIDLDTHCTVRDAHLFFSHRRERGLTGRMASVIGARR
jgi:YfiH family protein